MLEEKVTYPTFTIKHWWALREKFKRSLPTTVTAGYVETALSVNKRSAEILMAPLKSMGIIDADKKPLERATRWRDDETYPDVCAEIRNEIYPKELLDAVPGPTINRDAAQRWFAKTTGSGAVATANMAGLYQLLWEANPVRSDEQARPSPSSRSSKRPLRASSAKPKHSEVSSVPSNAPAGQGEPASIAVEPSSVQPKSPPALHINVQIHISAESTPDQIDQIFASMAKHFKDLT